MTLLVQYDDSPYSIVSSTTRVYMVFITFDVQVQLRTKHGKATDQTIPVSLRTPGIQRQAGQENSKLKGVAKANGDTCQRLNHGNPMIYWWISCKFPWFGKPLRSNDQLEFARIQLIYKYQENMLSISWQNVLKDEASDFQIV